MSKQGKINGQEYKIIKMSKKGEGNILAFLTHDNDGKNLRTVGEIFITNSQPKEVGKFLMTEKT